MINATFVSSFTVLYLHPLFFGMQTIFAINLLLSIYIFARSKFVQIYFFVQ